MPPQAMIPAPGMMPPGTALFLSVNADAAKTIDLFEYLPLS